MAVAPAESLADLENLVLTNNPTLHRMRQEASAEWARASYVAKLPDPSVGGMVYTPPMMYEPDRQRAELQAMQMIPWLGRLRAEERQACFEAMAAENMYRAERLRVLGELRANWFKLYVLGKQIETAEAEKAQVDSLVKTASARVATGDAQPGDVLMATLELGNLQEQLLSYGREQAAAAAEINRLAGRDVATPIMPPTTLEQEMTDWNFEFLRQVAHESQPELNAARLRTAASRWGVEVARLRRRPDLTLGAGWMVMDAPGAMMPGAGRDSFTLGVTTTVPLWKRKYDAISTEATRKHYAAHATEEETTLEIDSMLYDLWQQAEAGRRTLELYEGSILPQARQTFEADQQSLVNNMVSFDRVVRDHRTLLTLQLGYHKALGEYATTLARIRQTVGVDLFATAAAKTHATQAPHMAN
ncbi:MAG: TolC family protein [Planctomycetaceae bacterium]|nr:TolC family protein [Planctomycetaceae bacterium]